MSTKVTAGALAGAITTVAVWILNTWVLSAPDAIPGEIGAAITTILTFIVGYFIPETRRAAI
jgi:hypothetical protein